jgi:hypothetical protein
VIRRKSSSKKIIIKGKRLTRKSRKNNKKGKRGGDTQYQTPFPPSNTANLTQSDDEEEDEEITYIDKESIVEYWKNQYSNARDGEELSESDENAIYDFLDNVRFNPNYTTHTPSDDIDPTIFTTNANHFVPFFNGGTNANEVSTEYVALCNQANDAIEGYLFSGEPL